MFTSEHVETANCEFFVEENFIVRREWLKKIYWTFEMEKGCWKMILPIGNWIMEFRDTSAVDVDCTSGIGVTIRIYICSVHTDDYKIIGAIISSSGDWKRDKSFG